jgi:DUF1365 family protein
MPSSPSLYMGPVAHQRIGPVRHGFRYTVMSVLLDIDGDHTPPDSFAFAVDKWRLIYFRSRDHGWGDGDLRGWIKALLPDVSNNLGRVQVLTTPRVLGLVFNPLSVFFCFDQRDVLCGIVFEVSNFHEGRQSYPFYVPTPSKSVLRFRCAKKFHVSPFNYADGEYRFRLRRDGDKYRLGIQLFREGQLVLTAAHAARKRPLGTRSLLGSFPLNLINPIRMVSAIYGEAGKLWLKGLRLHMPRKDTVDTTDWRR